MKVFYSDILLNIFVFERILTSQYIFKSIVNGVHGQRVIATPLVVLGISTILDKLYKRQHMADKNVLEFRS